MKIFLCGLFFVIMSINLVFSQEKHSYIIDTNSGNCYLFHDNFNVKSDTTHYYICFESDFNQDTVIVYANDSIIFSEIISTNNSSELAEIIKIGLKNKVNYFGFMINDETPILFKVIEDKNYMRVKYYETSNGEKCIYVCFSKYKPYYY